MENNCFVGIQIVTFSAADGERLHDCLKAERRRQKIPGCSSAASTDTCSALRFSVTATPL